MPPVGRTLPTPGERLSFECAAFESLAYTDRKEYARSIDEAKRGETRHRRVLQTL